VLDERTGTTSRGRTTPTASATSGRGGRGGAAHLLQDPRPAGLRIDYAITQRRSPLGSIKCVLRSHRHPAQAAACAAIDDAGHGPAIRDANRGGAILRRLGTHAAGGGSPRRWRTSPHDIGGRRRDLRSPARTGVIVRPMTGFTTFHSLRVTIGTRGKTSGPRRAGSRRGKGGREGRPDLSRVIPFGFRR